MNVYAVYQDASRHTAILLEDDGHKVKMVAMAVGLLDITKMPSKTFHAEYKPTPDYPVRRAAEMYLGSPVPQEVTPEVRGHLERILADPAYAYDASQFATQPKKEPTMATEKKAAPAAKKTPAPAAKKTPAPAAKKTTAAAAKKAAPAAKTPKASREDTTTYKVADDSGVKRGFVREFVDAAAKLKTFTRDKLIAAMAGSAEEEKLMRYFYYCTGHGIFAAAK